MREWIVRFNIFLRTDFEIIQHGWNECIFSPEQIQIDISANDFLNTDYINETKISKEAEWHQNSQTDGKQVGVRSIAIFEQNETYACANLLKLDTQQYNWYAFLATGRLMYNGTQEEKECLKEFMSSDYLQPDARIPHPLGIGITIFCENYSCVLIATRSDSIEAVGDYENLKKFTAVGENTKICDIALNTRGGISIYNTAIRGLIEECGIGPEDVNILQDDIKIHSFLFDHLVQDYKFSGHINFNVPYHVIAALKSKATENENKELKHYPLETRQDCLNLINEIISNRQLWSREAAYGTISSLLIVKKDIISDADVNNIVAGFVN